MKFKLKKRDKIRIYCYDKYICYNCNKENEIIHVYLERNNESNKEEDNQNIGLIELDYLNNDNIGKKINKLFPYFFKDHSKTAEESYYMNHCQHCGAKFGDWFVYLEWQVDHAYDPIDPIRELIIEF